MNLLNLLRIYQFFSYVIHPNISNNVTNHLFNSLMHDVLAPTLTYFGNMAIFKCKLFFKSGSEKSLLIYLIFVALSIGQSKYKVFYFFFDAYQTDFRMFIYL